MAKQWKVTREATSPRASLFLSYPDVEEPLFAVAVVVDEGDKVLLCHPYHESFDQLEKLGF